MEITHLKEVLGYILDNWNILCLDWSGCYTDAWIYKDLSNHTLEISEIHCM